MNQLQIGMNTGLVGWNLHLTLKALQLFTVNISIGTDLKQSCEAKCLICTHTQTHTMTVIYDTFFLTQFWLDHSKPLVKQISQNKEYAFKFSVKFYTPHPNLLEDEYTRFVHCRYDTCDVCCHIIVWCWALQALQYELSFVTSSSSLTVSIIHKLHKI